MKGCDLLFIEDEPSVQSLVSEALHSLGIKIHCESQGASGLARARDYLPKVVLLDLGLPDRDGLDVLRDLRTWYEGSIVILTAIGDEEKKLRAFELGADDYVSKPFSPKELLARIKVALRHTRENPASAANEFRIGDLNLDPANHIAKVKDQIISLTQTEWQFLELLGHEPGRLYTQKDILLRIWGPNHSEDSHYLRILVSKLRKKLKESKSIAEIITEPGIGYRIS